MTENWETPSCDELTDIDSRADQSDFFVFNGLFESSPT